MLILSRYESWIYIYVLIKVISDEEREAGFLLILINNVLSTSCGAYYSYI